MRFSWGRPKERDHPKWGVAKLNLAKIRVLVGAGRFELPTSWSQTRRPAAGPRPDLLCQEMIRRPLGRKSLYCPLAKTLRESAGGFRWYPRRGSNSRLWLRRPALYPLSYRGLYQVRISWADYGQQGDCACDVLRATAVAASSGQG